MHYDNEPINLQNLTNPTADIYPFHHSDSFQHFHPFDHVNGIGNNDEQQKKQQELLAKQQAIIHRAVKDIIEGKSDRVSLIDLNHHTRSLNSNRCYLNDQHPFYHLINAYYLFDPIAFRNYFFKKNNSPYTQLLLMCDVLINTREHLELKREINGPLSINQQALDNIYCLLNALKINSHSPEFRKALSQYNHDTGYTDNFRTYTQYIRNLFNQYSRLLIIRVDLSYQQQQITNYDTFRTDMDYLLKLIPSNPVFKDLIGYIWKLEYGIDKGYHAHLLLCYDGAKRRSDYHIAKQVGELWQHDITLGRGLYYNCNAKEKKESYKNCYLGMVHRSEIHKINWIKEHGIRYLVKTDEYLRLMKPDNRRILGRGVMKVKNK